MSRNFTAKPLTLPHAVAKWCARRLVAAVKESEKLVAEQCLIDLGLPRLGGSPEPATAPAVRMAQDRLIAAWKLLQDDFVERLLVGKIILRGRIGRDESSPILPIPPHVCGSLTFAFRRNSATLASRTFRGIQAFRAYKQDAELAPELAVPTDAEGRLVLRVADVAYLSDDVVLELLEEHGRRVVKQDAKPFIRPSKISYGPILRRRMEWRARHGQLASTLSAECRELRNWLESKIEHHQLPTERGLEIPLRDTYRQLKATTTRINE